MLPGWEGDGGFELEKHAVWHASPPTFVYHLPASLI